ncbi:hypothetical protein DIPPA_32392 [Diplonema papillatum]|nr:hypothetical protein DIPPA_32392 [Diplonema papillatum]
MHSPEEGPTEATLLNGTGILTEEALRKYAFLLSNDLLQSMHTGKVREAFSKWMDDNVEWESHPELKLGMEVGYGIDFATKAYNCIVQKVLLGGNTLMKYAPITMVPNTVQHMAAIEFEIIVRSKIGSFKAFRRWEFTISPVNHRVTRVFHMPLHVPMRKMATDARIPPHSYPLLACEDDSSEEMNGAVVDEKAADDASSPTPGVVPKLTRTHRDPAFYEFCKQNILAQLDGGLPAVDEPPTLGLDEDGSTIDCGTAGEGVATIPPLPPPSIEKPCVHNDWDSVRVKRNHVLLRCRTCAAQWKVESKSIIRCAQFSSSSTCQNGDECPETHVYARKQTKDERQQYLLDKMQADGVHTHNGLL